MVTRALCITGVLAACTSSTMVTSPPPSQAAWDQARAVVAQHVATRERWLVNSTPEAQPGAPFLFVMRPAGYPLLVDDGAVIGGGGLEALRAYLDDSGVIAGRTLTVTTFRTLLE